jgi:ubiquinone/menaquinone biosynthesis C-methylase UbiE
MSVQHAYNRWSQQYDDNDNKTRDLEGTALRSMFSDSHFSHCLEIGCGTGKNTSFLLERCDRVLAVDLSEGMLEKARQKINSPNVSFVQADINQPWVFGQAYSFDLITCSLVLEHIENLRHIFSEAGNNLQPGGQMYIGELHPFKQYTGSKARFDTGEGTQVVQCYTHHISEFIQTAGTANMAIKEVKEFFDDNDRNNIPRILTLVFERM